MVCVSSQLCVSPRTDNARPYGIYAAETAGRADTIGWRSFCPLCKEGVEARLNGGIIILHFAFPFPFRCYAAWRGAGDVAPYDSLAHTCAPNKKGASPYRMEKLPEAVMRGIFRIARHTTGRRCVF